MARRILNLHRDPVLSLLPWVMGLVALVFAISLMACITVIQNSASNQALAQDEAVVVIPWQVDKLSQKERVNRVIELIIETPALTDPRVMSEEEQKTLLAPWLGPNISLNSTDPLDVAIPTLVKFKVNSPASVEKQQLDKFGLQLSKSVQDARLVLNQEGRDAARRVSLTLVSLSLFALALALFTMVLVIIFAVRILLRTQAATIETLQQLGATRDFIGKQMQSIALRIGLAGGLIAICVLALVAVVLWFSIPDETLLRAWLEASLLGFLVSLIVTPLLATLVSWLGTKYGLLQSLVDLENMNKV